MDRMSANRNCFVWDISSRRATDLELRMNECINGKFLLVVQGRSLYNVLPSDMPPRMIVPIPTVNSSTW